MIRVIRKWLAERRELDQRMREAEAMFAPRSRSAKEAYVRALEAALRARATQRAVYRQEYRKLKTDGKRA